MASAAAADACNSGSRSNGVPLRPENSEGDHDYGKAGPHLTASSKQRHHQAARKFDES
jgi:hypothetical protein